MKNILSKIKKQYHHLKNKLYFINFALGTAKILLGLVSLSYEICISALYNIAIGLSKKGIHSGNKNRKIVGLFIILSCFIYTRYSIFIIKNHINSNYHMYIAMIIATITFTEITITVINIIKFKKCSDYDSLTLKSANLASSIISFSLTQSAILSFTNKGIDMSFANGLGGIFFSLLSSIVGLILIITNKK